mmetsp:Transcript_8284/g.28386  ORF Transcript_8284/g.28386 Transcript_8284/m.28386 type:complete len:229 (-) Transcript_8284:417-1103(-)
MTVSRRLTAPARRIASTSSSKPLRIMMTPSPKLRIAAFQWPVSADAWKTRRFRSATPPRSCPASGGRPTPPSTLPQTFAPSQVTKSAQPGPLRGSMSLPWLKGEKTATSSPRPQSSAWLRFASTSMWRSICGASRTVRFTRSAMEFVRALSRRTVAARLSRDGRADGVSSPSSSIVAARVSAPTVVDDWLPGVQFRDAFTSAPVNDDLHHGTVQPQKLRMGIVIAGRN